MAITFDWCPRAESNHDLMITNQLHDLHATGADLPVEARIISEANELLLRKDRSHPSTSRERL